MITLLSIFLTWICFVNFHIFFLSFKGHCMIASLQLYEIQDCLISLLWQQVHSSIMFWFLYNAFYHFYQYYINYD